MMSHTQRKEPLGRKTYTDPTTGEKKQGAVVPLAKIRADAIWAKFKPYVEQHEPFGNRLLVGVFVTEKFREIALPGGGTAKLELPDDYVKEDVWQGVCGLVLQLGPGCFIDSDKWKFFGQKVEVGDWVTFQPAHSVLRHFGDTQDGLECRIIQDCYLDGRVSGPHCVR